jgi:rhamnulokinase
MADMETNISVHLGFDLGAGSGRAMLGELRDGHLSLREIHRFPTGFLSLLGHKYWNIYRMFEEFKKALSLCAGIREPDTIGVDTWGVDFGLLDRDGRLIGLPYSYRDPYIEGAMADFLRKMPREELYGLTGIQMMPINSLFQLEAMVRDGSQALASADALLFMADIFHYMLTGVKKTEFTFATTSQVFNPAAMGWDGRIISKLGIRPTLLQDIVMPGTMLGELTPDLAGEAGLPQVPVVAVATHDTASAVAAVPASGRNCAYISSGTWSLLGVEAALPVINAQSLAYNFTNEGGVGGRWRVLKNIAGLWLLQECLRVFSQEEPGLTYERLVAEAAAADSFASLVDPDRPEFLAPADMPAAIAAECRRTGQDVPCSRGEMCRCIFNSLACKYRYVLERVQKLHPFTIEVVHIIGGGSKNGLLCQLTADTIGIPVIAGPTEATAIGNILVQAMALKRVRDLDELRGVVRDSFETKLYPPSAARDSAERNYERFLKKAMG